MGRFYYWLFGGSLIWFPQVYLHLCIALVDTYAPTYLLTLGKILGLLIFALWFSQLILAGLSILPPGSHCETKLTEAESKGERKRLRCCRCSSKTEYKCDRCSRPGKPVPLCLPQTEEPAGRKLTLFGNMIFRAACLHRNEYWIVYGDKHSY